MKRYPNDPMYMNAYDFYDLGVSMQKTKQPSSIYVPNNIQVPQDIQVPEDMPLPEEDFEEYDYEKDEVDRNYMISLYPDLCKRIQTYVEKECDELEYDGSVMYDEYPDKEAILAIVAKIYYKVEDECQIPKMAQDLKEEKSEVDTQQVGVPGNVWLWDNVQVQFLNELFGRRRRRYPRRYGYRLYPYRYRYYRKYPRYPYMPYQPYVPYDYRYYYYY